MRRFSSASLFVLAAILFFTLFWSACGGGSSNNQYAITKFVFSPTLISMEPGQVILLTASPYNSSGSIVSATITYSTSDATAAGISPGGSLCAGQWDATFTICTPASPPKVGTYTITASANGATGTTTVYVHYHVDAVFLTPPTTACTTMGKTAGVTATACTTLADSYGTCTVGTCGGNPAMCDVSKSVGGFNYGVIDSSVASIDTNGTLTAGIPGTTKIYASVTSGNGSNATVSQAQPYTTCLVDSINLHVSGNTDTSTAVAKSSSATLQADVLDTTGASITPQLQFNNLQSVVGTSTASSSSNQATYTGEAPGYGQVVASCTPPNCNKNVSAVFSNVLSTTVENSSSDTGVTANETNVFVSGNGAVQMYPVDTTNFTLGTLISLPYAANSMAMTRDGAHIFLGSSTYGMVVSTSDDSVQTLSFPGKVLAISPDNSYVIFANTDASNNGSVNIVSASSLTIANSGGFAIPNVDAATFTPDGNTVYFAAGKNLYRYRIVGDSGSTPVPLTLTPGGAPLNAAANDIATSANGTVLFSATTPAIVADETCNANLGGQFQSAFEPLGEQSFLNPTQLVAIPNGTGMLAVDGSQIDQVSITTPNPLTSPFAGCPATGFATSASTINLSSLGTGFTVNKVVMSNSGHYAAALTGCTGGGCTPQVGIIDLTKGTVTPVKLVDKGTAALTQVFAGDFMIDDSGVWVTADDSYLHFVSIAKLADTEQVQVQIQGPSSGSTPTYVNPTFVAVQHK